MRFNREARRTTAQLLNGVAVATLAATAIAPLTLGTVQIARLFVGALVAALLHLVAITVVSGSRG